MSLELCVLGSGSSGNSTVVRSAWGTFLLDAGFGPRTTAQRLHGIGLSLHDLSAIVLTHLDHAALAAYCAAYALWAEATEAIQKYGAMVNPPPASQYSRPTSPLPTARQRS